ncbi:hypothetical protein OUZ56_023835 [Daphnia magna]|uniref:Uncharacterized protein n=1 Tax=Daphnia magna TaxID=35525 RepID=A0ABR0AZU1_9CRUS|nr:hypothetical protein OUZ56_023835 [Daphnia magna]
MHKALLTTTSILISRTVGTSYHYIHKSPVKSKIAPDVTYVIDFCLIKELVTDPDTNLSRPVGRIPPTSADYYSAGYTIKPPPQCKRENGREPDSNEKSRSSSLIESLLFHGAATSAECGKLIHVDDCIDHQQSLSIVEIVFLIIDQ